MFPCKVNLFLDIKGLTMGEIRFASSFLAIFLLHPAKNTAAMRKAHPRLFIYFGSAQSQRWKSVYSDDTRGLSEPSPRFGTNTLSRWSDPLCDITFVKNLARSCKASVFFAAGCKQRAKSDCNRLQARLCATRGKRHQRGSSRMCSHMFLV